MYSENRMSAQPDKGLGNGELVYVVDDEEIFAEVVAAILRSEDYQTRTFDNAEAAVVAIDSSDRKPDVLLTDYVMPGMNGMELIITARTKVEGLKTILFSGQVKEDILGSFAVQPDRFIGKPFQPKVLLEMIADVSA
jgi:CheY-like chemotaxis protein